MGLGLGLGLANPTPTLTPNPNQRPFAPLLKKGTVPAFLKVLFPLLIQVRGRVRVRVSLTLP